MGTRRTLVFSQEARPRVHLGQQAIRALHYASEHLRAGRAGDLADYPSHRYVSGRENRMVQSGALPPLRSLASISALSQATRGAFLQRQLRSECGFLTYLQLATGPPALTTTSLPSMTLRTAGKRQSRLGLGVTQRRSYDSGVREVFRVPTCAARLMLGTTNCQRVVT